MENLIVLKIGGNALKDKPKDFYSKLKQWVKENKHIVIIHGGGTKIDNALKQMNRESKKINGIRVTKKEDMKIIEKTLINQIGLPFSKCLIVNEINAFQIKQVNLRDMVKATFLNKSQYGWVGKINYINESAISSLLQQQFIPIFPSLASVSDHELINVNADHLASSIAVSLKAEQLIFLTDVKGVIEKNKVLNYLSLIHI